MHEIVGYTSEIAFAAAFKGEYGITPARYRRRPQVRTGLPVAPPVPRDPGRRFVRTDRADGSTDPSPSGRS
jgi:AraC-like DNA-binding protein